MRLTETQRLALEAIHDGALDYAHSRTVDSLLAKQLITYVGSGGSDSESYRLTEGGAVALNEDRRARGLYYDQQKAKPA